MAVVGPTGAGKSALAIGIARAVGGEIVNGDSMQIYRGMDIGTAKTPVSERHGVRHHLLDVLDVSEPATVAEFQQRSRAAIRDCRMRGAVPVLVGGSALYVRAVLDDFEFPGTDAVVRARWEAVLAELGPQHLHRALTERDPEAGAAILPSNGRRIVRALEVLELTGKPFRATLPAREYVFGRTVQLGIDVPRDLLDDRLAERVDRMWAAGFVDEVRRLEREGLRRGRTASRALGYRQLLDFLAGEVSEDEARADTLRATRRFARRQDAWFRKDLRIRWLPYDAHDAVDSAVTVVRSMA